MSDSPRKLVVLNEPLTRRSLLEAGLVAALALPFAAACGPGPDEGPNDAGPDGGERSNDAGPTAVPDAGADAGSGCSQAACTVDANTLVLPLADHPELVPVLGWKVYTDSRYTDPICQGDQILVIQVSQGQYVALSASCTHACCTVELSTNGSGYPEIYCPCHQSTYNLQGGADGGPAPQSLPPLPVCFDGCTVYVQLK
jgi:Rieske Fe-S protein